VANRITFADQQRRAVNLIWALLSESRVVPGDRIAIVGAGIAGVTAASYATMRGLRVSLFEQHAEPFAIQRGSGRWIHPNVYEWPLPIWQIGVTSLPCMNWRAGSALDVISSLWPQWLTLLKESSFTWHPSCTVESFDTDHSNAIVIDSNGVRHGPYCCIVAAIGFGEERSIPELDSKPYWKDDDLHQRMRNGGTALVSGCGDGGLVDAMRIALRDFRHNLLAEIAEASSTNQRTIEALRGIERNVPRYPNGEVLTRAIMDVDVPPAVADLLNSKRRDNTTVILNGRSDGAFARTSCMLNRFVIAQLMKLGAIVYQRGAFDRGAITRSGAEYSCVIDGRTILASAVVVRHGPTEGSLKKFPAIATALVPVRTFLQTYSAGVDRTRTQAWGALENPARPPAATASGPAFKTEALDRLASRIQEITHTMLTPKGHTPYIEYTRGVNGIYLDVQLNARKNRFRIDVSNNETIAFGIEQNQQTDGGHSPVMVFTADKDIFSASDAELQRWVLEAMIPTLETGGRA